MENNQPSLMDLGKESQEHINTRIPVEEPSSLRDDASEQNKIKTAQQAGSTTEGLEQKIAEQPSRPDQSGRKTKIVIVSIISALVVLTAVYFFLFYKAAVTVSVEPNSAQIEIGQFQSVGSGVFKLKPGNYTLKVTLTDYVPYEKTIKVKSFTWPKYNITLNHLSEPLKVVDYPAQFVTFSPEQNSFFYLSNQGRTIYRLDNLASDSKQKPYAVTNAVFSNVQDLAWHPSREIVLAKQAERWSMFNFNRYDLLNQTFKEWPEGIGNLIWHPKGEKVVYYYQTDKETSLIRANKDNSQMERIYNLQPTNIRYPKMHWSNDGQTILIVDNSIFVFDLYSKTLKQLEQFQAVTEAVFTPDDQNIIYQKDDRLYMIDLDGQNRQDLNIATPLAKTAWLDNDNLLYFWQKDSTDKIFKYNYKTKNSIEYAYNPKYTIHARNLNISKDKSKVFYNQDEYLYSLKLVGKEY